MINRKTAIKIVEESLIDGTPLESWWDRQATDTQEAFMDSIRTSVQNKEGSIAASQRLSDALRVRRNHAEALVTTSLARVANKAREQTYLRRDDVKGIQQLSVLDSRTSDICISYSNATWDLNFKPILGNRLPYNGGVPRHFRCRSIIVPILKGQDPPGDTTFDAFLKSKTEAEQNRILGKGKANLWRKGKIGLSQLVNMRGRPLSLTELEAKIAKKRAKSV